jgi:hypothetical protein
VTSGVEVFLVEPVDPVEQSRPEVEVESEEQGRVEPVPPRWAF